MSTYAIIGASRGIGLHFVLQLAARPGATVFAVVRSLKTSNHLLSAASDKKNVHIVEGDVADYASLERAAKQIADVTGGKLDCLIHNAARLGSLSVVFGYDDYPDINALDEDFIDGLRINTLGVIHSIKAFLPLLRASTAPVKKIAVIVSAAGDWRFALKAEDGEAVAYAATKAASIVVTTKWALKLKNEGIAVVSFNPGAVDTTGTRGESGSPEFRPFLEHLVATWKTKGIDVDLLTPEESVSMQLKAIDELTMDKTGTFLANTGEIFSV